jgi:hypothetical protein
MKIIDSNKKLLPGPEIITEVVYKMDLGGLDPTVALISIIKETTMDGAELKQYGNTVFLGHYTADKTGVLFRTFNMDTAKNVVDNGERYIKYLISQGVTKVCSQFYGHQFLHVFKLMSKRPGTENMTFNYHTTSNKGHIVEVILSSTPQNDGTD